MTYPKATEYVAAVQDTTALLDPDLARATFTLHPRLQIPFPASGNSAVVFQATIDGRPYALRFFIRDDASSRGRYGTLRAFVERERLTDCTATTQWVDAAIEVRGERWPMVKMEWIDGRALDAYVASLVRDQNRAALQGLAMAWLQLVQRLQGVRFAHGDLQHGNVLVDTSSRLRLVDFDGCWTPDSVGPPPTETGHPNYQLSGRSWGRWMDTFPGLLVYTALCGLAREPELWKTYGARENILFTKDDFLRPFETPVWSDLRSLGDPAITRSLSQLSAACGARSGLAVPIEAVVDGRADPPRPSAARPTGARPTYTSSPLGATAWWERTGAAPAAPPPLPPPPPTSPQSADPRFSTAQHAPWRGQSARSTVGAPPGSPPGAPPGAPRWGGLGAPGGLGPPGGAAPPGGVPPRGGPGSPPTPGPVKKRRWVAAVVIIVMILVVLIMINSCLSQYPSAENSSAGSSTGDLSPYSSPLDTPPPDSPEPSSDVELLRAHVPFPLSISCTPMTPPDYNPAVAALQCSDAVTSIGVGYYAYESAADLSDTYQGRFSTDAGGSCSDDEPGAGTNADADGDRIGDYSCYDTPDGDHVLTWTHEPAGILTVAYSKTISYSALIEWANAHAGPTA